MLICEFIFLVLTELRCLVFMLCFFLYLIMCLILGQTIVPSTLQISAMVAQMLAISPVLSLISAMVRKRVSGFVSWP